MPRTLFSPEVNLGREWLVRRISGLSFPRLGRKGTVYSLTKKQQGPIPEGILNAIAKRYLPGRRTRESMRIAVTMAFEDGFITLEEYDECMDHSTLSIYLAQGE